MRILLLVLLVCLALPALPQQASFPDGYYVIVGAFAKKENAKNFNSSLQQKGMTAAYGYLPSRGLYYVYTLNNTDVTVCADAAKELRKQPEFFDAWVRYISEHSSDSVSAPAETVTVKEPEIIKKEEPAITASTHNSEPQNLQQQQPTEPEVKDTTSVTENEGFIQFDKITLANTEVFLSLYNAANDRVVEGKVQVVDADRGRLITEVKGNTYLMMPDPKNTTGKITLICDAFGYRKIQKELNYNDPLNDTSVIQQMGTSLVASFALVRYEKGDIRTLYNVYFYNDAAVMLPESKFELNEILVMMQENPGYKILLHGHTNGNYHGKIIKVGPSGNFFSVAEDAITTIGSAKELSESRAEVIKDWLVANGIDASRIDVKSWGGKRPLYDKHSANAKKNIRVEVEVVGK